MNKIPANKTLIFLFALGGLVALGLLSAALRDFSFRPTETLSFAPGLKPTAPLSLLTAEISTWKIAFLGGLLLVIFVALLFLMDVETRKRVLLKIFRFAMLMLALWLLLNYAFERGSLSQLLNLTGFAGDAATLTTTASVLPEYAPPVISPWLVLAVSFFLGLGLVGFFWLAYLRRPGLLPEFPKATLAGIARETLQEFESGQDWENAILRCYVRMNQVVLAERGLARQTGVTPAEFALRLERAGLPGEAVRTLTRLFEQVRYGGQTSSPADRELASAALNAILHECGVQA